jgi:hypothetical protein
VLGRVLTVRLRAVTRDLNDRDSHCGVVHGVRPPRPPGGVGGAEGRIEAARSATPHFASDHPLRSAAVDCEAFRVRRPHRVYFEVGSRRWGARCGVFFCSWLWRP